MNSPLRRCALSAAFLAAAAVPVAAADSPKHDPVTLATVGPAFETARRILGDGVASAVDVRSGRPERWYIVATLDESYAEHGKIAPYDLAVRLIRLDDPEPTVLDPRLVVDRPEGLILRSHVASSSEPDDSPVPDAPLLRAFDIVDIDADGAKEIYAVEVHFGSGGVAFDMGLYEIGSRDRRRFEGRRAYREKESSLDAPFSPDPGDPFAVWMLRQVEEIDRVTYGWCNPPLLEDQWEARNGRGYREGRVQIDYRPGPMPSSEASVLCEVADERYQWFAFFRGAVWAYDRKLDRHFVVFVPEEPYSEVDMLVSGRRFLWMREGASVLAFEKETSTLHWVGKHQTLCLDRSVVHRTVWQPIVVPGVDPDEFPGAAGDTATPRCAE